MAEAPREDAVLPVERRQGRWMLPEPCSPAQWAPAPPTPRASSVDAVSGGSDSWRPSLRPLGL
eukprot:3823720-Alexandrium_andersonii.AAC.1